MQAAINRAIEERSQPLGRVQQHEGGEEAAGQMYNELDRPLGRPQQQEGGEVAGQMYNELDLPPGRQRQPASARGVSDADGDARDEMYDELATEGRSTQGLATAEKYESLTARPTVPRPRPPGGAWYGELDRPKEA